MLVTGSQIGKYLLGKKLGQGGFGVVFRAHDGSLDREVALKFLNDEHTTQPQILQRFLQEARSAAKIAHPGIVTVYECGQLSEANNAAYIAMELLDGESLTDRLARAGRLPADQAVEITRQVASALEAAHRTGIIHRDLKPDNIFLVRDPAVMGGERVKVLDFGIAKLGRSASSSVQTQSMMVFGTPRYMSPEQCKSAANVDARSDIYTLGCILYELISGRPPFAGAPGELVAQHVLVEAPSLDAAAPDASLALVQLVGSMLSKEPDERPATMAAVQRALEQLGAVLPGVAPTLLPGMVPLAPRIGTRPGTSPVAVSASPTTLGGAASSSVVGRASSARRGLLVGLLGAAVVVGVVIALVVGTGGGSGQQVAANAPPIDAPPSPVEREPVAKPPEPTRPEVKPPAVNPDDVVIEPTTQKPKQPVVRPRTVVKTDGTLTVTTKPSCEVSIDGAASFHTPIRGFKLATGKHKLTLTNAEHGISETFTIDIAPGEAEVVARDYSDRIKKADPPKTDPPKTDPPKTDPKDAKDKTINPFAKKPQ